jgi:hypothetical protein
MLTKIDFCGATGHDHGGWLVATAAETKTALTAEAAAVGRRTHHQWRWRKHRDNNDGNDRLRRLQRGLGIRSLSTTATGTTTMITTTMMAAVTMKTIMTMTVARGTAVAVLTTEPALAAEAAEAASVATTRADNNQQRAAKTATAAIAVGKRRQARGEKQRGRQGRRQGRWWGRR